jgi:hypothetical protein
VLVMLLSVPAPESGEIDQVTPAFAGSFCTLAVNTCVLPARTVADWGDTDTATTAGTVMVALADTEVFATEVAAIVTVSALASAPAGGL